MGQKQSGEIVTQSELDSARILARSRHIHADFPGELVCIDTFYIGCIKGVGRIYQMTGIDAATSYGWAKIFTDKTAAAAVDFLHEIIQNACGVTVANVLTDNGTEFTSRWRTKQHRFEQTLWENRIVHRYTKVRHPWTNGFVERLNRTINEEFYQVAFRTKFYRSIWQLQEDLNRFITFYNTQRPHRGYRLNGKCPADLFFPNAFRVAV